MEQLLTKQLPAADRPYSQHELADIRQRNLDRLNIGSTMVYHPNSGYFYLAKSGGKKEAAVLSGEVLEEGCCSVCWKLRKTPSELRDIANNMIDEFILRFEKKPEKWTRELIHLENTYYKWLYIDFDRKRGDRRPPRNNGGDNGGERRYRITIAGMIVGVNDDIGTIAEMIVVIEVGTTAAIIMAVSVATGPTTVVIMLQKKHL